MGFSWRYTRDLGWGFRFPFGFRVGTEKSGGETVVTIVTRSLGADLYYWFHNYNVCLLVVMRMQFIVPRADTTTCVRVPS